MYWMLIVVFESEFVFLVLEQLKNIIKNIISNNLVDFIALIWILRFSLNDKLRNNIASKLSLIPYTFLLLSYFKTHK